MHYYKKDIGQYYKKAGRLTMLQHGAYTMLMDSCYDREIFPTLEQALDWCWASTDEEINAVKFVLSKFFTEESNVFTQVHIGEVLDKYHETAATNKAIALKREADRRTKREQAVNEPPPNKELRTTNYELEIKNQKLRTTNQESEITNETPKIKTPVPQAAQNEIKEIFHFWKTTLNHPRSNLDDKRKALIRKNLKSGYSVADLKSAIIGCSNTPHNMGDNDRGQVYDSLELILRTSDHIDRFMRNDSSPPISRGQAGKRLNANIEAAKSVMGDLK